MSTVLREIGFVIAVLSFAVPSLVTAQVQDVTGQWELTVDFQGMPMKSTLLIYKDRDGALKARWGAAELSQVKLEGQRLSFVRTIRFGDQEFSMNFQGTIKDGKLTGTLSSDQGDSSVTGLKKAAKPDIVGVWDVSFEVFDRQITARLFVRQAPDGTISCDWTGEAGEHKVSNVKLQDGKLTFTRTSKIDQMEFETTFEGTAKANKLTGTLKGQMGQFEVTGTRFGAELIGLWELTTVSQFGTRQNLLIVEPDLTGSYEGFGGETPLKNLKLEGKQVTFDVEMGFGDRTFRMQFKGTLEAGSLKGQITSERGTSDVTGKRLQLPISGQAASSIMQQLVGTWEFTTETPGGTRTNTLKINPDLTGTYSSRNQDTPIQDLKVEGDQVSFKITRTFNENQFVMEFKGRLTDGKLVGEFVSERGSRPATGKKVGQ
ncbi:MAG: hypothetical protein QHH07_04985 [Sedimentisphaerales bacterium]|jgi:hypothetical protein|nr:hypothetical protein [Sedimentisphaerales bacterium]